MNEMILQVRAWALEGWLWVQQNVLEPARLIELSVILAGLFAARLCATALHKGIMRAFGDYDWVARADRRFLYPIMIGLIALILIWTGRFILDPVVGPLFLLPIATSLLSAWIVIRLAAGLIANRELARLIAGVAWTFAALNVVGLLGPLADVLDRAVLPVGKAEVSALDVLQGLVLFVLFLWLALAGAALIEKRVRGLQSVPVNARELLAKVSRIVLIALAVLISLNATGIDLTALAVFGGALGVGIGFGLQKVVGNFISGLILLMDRSIKPGDVIETGGTYGFINKLGARYTSVVTRDGTEYLIPNEDMITQPVINWSHSDRLVRLKIPVQISYASDLKKAVDLMNEAAGEEPRIVGSPAPRTLLKGFGESGVDLELRFWIEDPQNGVANIKSPVMLRIWDKFHEHGIEFPYPHRVIELKSQVPADMQTVSPLKDMET